VTHLGHAANRAASHRGDLKETGHTIAAIKNQLRARGIKIIDAMGIYISVVKQPGMSVPDHIHLSVEGNKKIATILAGMVR
jgi:acyl-CoA thioesterase I